MLLIEFKTKVNASAVIRFYFVPLKIPKYLHNSFIFSNFAAYLNMVAQMLRTSGNKLFYYTFPDGNKHSYEVDFSHYACKDTNFFLKYARVLAKNAPGDAFLT